MKLSFRFRRHFVVVVGWAGRRRLRLGSDPVMIVADLGGLKSP